MAKSIIKRGTAAFLALVMCVSLLGTAAFAKEVINGNTWYGDEVAVDVTAGTDGYTYMALFRKPAHGYEFSGHFMGEGEGPQTFVVLDTEKYDGTTWTPSGIYKFGESNYEVAYCCDVETMIVDGTYYKRLNLEDSPYYNKVAAAKIRAIVTNSYPYVSLEEMKAALVADGYAYANELTRNEIIAAVQTAIWACANTENGTPMRYAKSYKVSDNLQWGYPMHDTSAESGLEVSGKRVFENYPEVGTRIDSLVDYLLAQEATYAEKNEIVITDLKILDAIPVIGKGNTYEVVLCVALNGSGSDNNDKIDLKVIVNGETVETQAVKQGIDVYTMKVEIEAGDTIEAIVSGTQVLPLGVYFYAPKPADVNGDGVATGREVSQNLVAAAEGATPVYAADSVTLDVEPVFGSLELRKVDTYGAPLSGVEFTLYVKGNSGMLPVGTYAVDENGTLLFENLLPGEYELKETKAPYGYVIPEKSIFFEVTSNGIVEIEKSNYAEVTESEVARENIVEIKSGELTADEIANLGITVPVIDVTVALNPATEGVETTKTETLKPMIIGDQPAEGDTVYDYTEVTAEAYRKVTVTTSEVETVIAYGESEAVTGIQPALKFDRNDTADQKIQKANRELYTDNGHFHDPDTFTVTDAPEGYPWKYVGHGDYSGHYVSHVKVVYERDEAGNAIKDENGNYIIKELQHAGTGTPLYYNGELVTNPEGPFHFATGTRPQQFLLMNEKGETMYGYCIDLETGAESSTWYAMANLEDNDYYASEEAENHVRNIIMNGYWGTESGVGSLASLKEALKANKDMFDVEQDVTLVNRKKVAADYVTQEGEYHHGNYAYWSLPTEHVVLTDEIIDQLTEGEALDAMQAAIWSWANGSNGNLNGVDRAIVGDLYVSSSSVSDSLNGKNDPEGAARTKALYQYLMGLNDSQEPTVIINDKTFAKDMSLKIGEEVAEGVYAAELKFTVDGERNEKDNLKVVLDYTDIKGEPKSIEVALTGEGAAKADEQGFYTIDGLQLKADVPFVYSLQISGEQYLEKGAYIFTSEKGTNASQTMVTMAEGIKSVDVTKSMSITFTVEEGVKGTYKRHWSDAKTLIVKNTPPSVEWDSGKASNISFMLLDPDTGAVEFLYKNDIGGETSAKIPVEEGKVSVVFIKQSTSGMFWFSEEVDEAAQQAAIKCLKDHNPSYKGHNAVAFGGGEHELEFKTGKFATYTFHFGANVVIEDEVTPVTPKPELPVVPETPETPVVPETPNEPETTPAAPFHDDSKHHLLIDEKDPISFNLDPNYKAAEADKYAFVGHGEMSEFWPAILYYENGVGEPVATIGGVPLYNKGKGANVNGIYLNGKFYPGTVKAFYESVQQPVLMDNEGKAVAVYCADKATSTQTNTLYSVVNLEDAAHFGAETAAKLRAIAVNGYWGGTNEIDPTNSLANVKAMMVASGKFTEEEIKHLSPGVALAATQFAIWELANDGEESQIINVQYLEKDRVAYRNGKTWNTLVTTPDSEQACVDLIFKLSNYMATELPGISVKEMSTANTVLSYKNILQDVNIEVLKKAAGHANNADTNKDNDAFVTNVIFQMLPVGEKDNLTVKIIDKKTREVYAEKNIADLKNNGDGTYTFPDVVLVENNVNNYTVVVEGTQYLERNVYLYFAGERDASQTMIGYDEGEFSVNVESTVEKTFNVDDPTTVTFKKGEASNISFMLLDKATGEVEFLNKIDIGGETSFDIPCEAGKVSVVFIKQSTSGMFWFSEEVSEELQNAAIACLKANNPSYKGHNAIAFGGGDHELEFKKNKFATYSFDMGGMKVETENKTDKSVTEDTTVEPTVEEPEVETPKPEPEPEKAPAVTVKGAKVKTQIAKDGVTAVYIAANGKIPAVIWTSEDVDAATMAEIIDELGASSDAKIVSGFGSHTIEYQQNKNKTKTVTYTFEKAK